MCAHEQDSSCLFDITRETTHQIVSGYLLRAGAAILLNSISVTDW